MLVNFERDMIIYAFRYCLGRMTYSVSICVDWILENWDIISDNDKKLMFREIREAIEMQQAGMDCDVDNWKRILEKGE